MKEKKKLHYAWIVMIGLALASGGTAGLIYNCAGVYFAPIVTELGCDVSQLSLWFTTTGLAMVVALPIVGRILAKSNIRLLMTVCAVATIVASGLMSVYTQPWMWWISGAVIGFAGTFVMFVPQAIMIGQWFVKKRGLALGITMCAAGVVGAIMNPVLSSIIQGSGWRTAYVVQAIISAVLVLPCTIFLIRFKPADKGLSPYGYEASAAAEGQAAAQPMLTGVSTKRALRCAPLPSI